MSDQLSATLPWPERLRAQGRSIAWLARQTGVTRTYLSGVASGARSASPALLRAIERELGGAPDAPRLERTQGYAVRRALFLEYRDRLLPSLEGRLPALSPVEREELADELARLALEAAARFLSRVALS
jgi:transcriptional regulator with XRE-family HTH domain